jgi:hypothetical protein
LAAVPAQKPFPTKDSYPNRGPLSLKLQGQFTTSVLLPRTARQLSEKTSAATTPYLCLYLLSERNHSTDKSKQE